MKVLGNSVAFLFAMFVMGGLILAQRDYQNSWHEPAAIQMPGINGAGAPQTPNEYNVVLK
jgi:hypothetical protein